MQDAEGLFPVREIEEKESPVTKLKSKGKNKLKLSMSPKSKSGLRKNSLDS